MIFIFLELIEVFLDKFGSVIVRKGVSSLEPVPPINEDSDLMQLADINLPAYLYNTMMLKLA